MWHGPPDLHCNCLLDTVAANLTSPPPWPPPAVLQEQSGLLLGKEEDGTEVWKQDDQLAAVVQDELVTLRSRLAEDQVSGSRKVGQACLAACLVLDSVSAAFMPSPSTAGNEVAPILTLLPAALQLTAPRTTCSTCAPTCGSPWARHRSSSGRRP